MLLLQLLKFSDYSVLFGNDFVYVGYLSSLLSVELLNGDSVIFSFGDDSVNLLFKIA
jgi:hypothetical protein